MKRDHDAFDLFDEPVPAAAPAAAPFSSPLRGLFTSFLLQRAPAVSSDLRGADAAALADSLDAPAAALPGLDQDCVVAALEKCREFDAAMASLEKSLAAMK